jgi:hypothetical protein
MSLLHEKYEIMISEYVDGDLSETEEKELMLHLEACPDCAEHLAFVKKLSGSLPIANEIPSPDFAEKLMGKLSFESFEEEKKENRLIKFFNKKSLALAACLALVMITALFSLPRMGGGAKSADMAAAPQMAPEESANENKDEMKAFDYAADSEAGSGTEESRFGSSLKVKLSDISAENPVFRLYDSLGNFVFEDTDGAKLIGALLSEAHEDEKKETFKPDFEIVFEAENSDFRLNVYIEDTYFYIYSEDFGSSICIDKSFFELMRELFGLNLRS